MSSPKPRAKRRPSWFQDTKTGCEKQTDYFLKIRKLQKELINREQHNLVNAMERLKQLQYPRRKPVIRNFSLPEKGMSSAFPRRSYPRRDALRRQQNGTNKIMKPLEGRHLLPDENISLENEEEMASFTLEDIRHLYNRMLPVLNDRQIAKIANEVRTTFPNEPSTYLLQPHLPSIPNVKRKTTTRIVNRLKLLTLSEESEYRTLSNPKIASSLLLQRKGTSYASSLPDNGDEKKDQNSKGHMLYFDVDPNDSSVFVHSAIKEQTDDADDFIDDDVKNDHGSPFPPPNSRPNSHVADKAPATEDSENEPVLVESSAVSTVDMKVEETAEKPEVFQEENQTENSFELSAHDDVNIDQPKDDTENSPVDDVDNGDKPSENQSPEYVSPDVNQDFDDNQMSEISISEPKVIIKKNKTPVEN